MVELVVVVLAHVPPAHVDGARGAFGEVEDGTSGGALLVLGHAHLEGGEVELKDPAWGVGPRPAFRAALGRCVQDLAPLLAGS